MFQLAQHSLVRLQSFRRRFGCRATLVRVAQELRGRPAAPAPSPARTTETAAGTRWAPIARADTQLSAPIRFYLTPRRNRRRLTVVGERFDLRHPCEAACTALVLATAAANRLGADLRVVTRLGVVQPGQLEELLLLNDVALQGESIFQCAPVQGPDPELDRFDDEVFLVTSWHSAVATLAMVPPRQVVYLVQADERLLHPRSELRARCEAVLMRQDLRFVVHTRQLLDHLVEQGLPHMRTCAVSFEPAFPARAFQPQPRAAGGKRSFIFHAAPTTERDLFRLGLATIEKALAQGVLDPRRWELLFVGRDMPEVVLASGQRPRHLHDLDTSRYLQLLGQTDLGLSLCPPGLPSRMALDLAASGAAVVVNGAAGLPQPRAPGLIACPADVDALLQGLRGALGLVDQGPRPTQPALATDWAHTLHGSLDHLAAAR